MYEMESRKGSRRKKFINAERKTIDLNTSLFAEHNA
jgi:hypothetical protein